MAKLTMHIEPVVPVVTEPICVTAKFLAARNTLAAAALAIGVVVLGLLLGCGYPTSRKSA